VRGAALGPRGAAPCAAAAPLRRRRQTDAAAAAARAGPAAAAAAPDAAAEAEEAKRIEDLDLDEFLAGDFLAGGADAPGASSDDDEASGSEPSGSEDGLGSDDDADEGLAAPAAAAGSESESDEDGASDSDDGDADVAGGGAVRAARAQNRLLADEVASHRAQLDSLRALDPEFYAYLELTDKELLAFGGGDGSGGGSSSSEEEAEEEEEEAVAPAKGGARKAAAAAAAAEAAAADAAGAAAAGAPQTVTLELVDAWGAAALERGSLGAARALFRAYRAACHYGDSEESVDAGLRIGSSAAYNRLMLFALRHGDGILRRLLGAPEGAVEEAALAGALGKLPRWKKVEPLVKSYLGNTLHLLGRFRGLACAHRVAACVLSLFSMAPVKSAAPPVARAPRSRGSRDRPRAAVAHGAPRRAGRAAAAPQFLDFATLIHQLIFHSRRLNITHPLTPSAPTSLQPPQAR
jgi:hypothetical protein